MFVPEWQGYGESPAVLHGAHALRDELRPTISFTSVDIAAREDLRLECDILGYRANLRILGQVREAIERANPETIFLLGGTCASEIAPVSFLNTKHGRDLTVLWFDAHADLNTPESSPSKHFHGMPLRVLLGDGPDEIRAAAFSRLLPSQVILAGSRDLDAPERAYVEAQRITSVSIAGLTDGAALREAIRRSGSSKLYVHLDLDVLEPQDFPHLLIPTPGGLRLDELVDVLTRLRDEFPIVGSSILEYVPVDGGDPKRLKSLAEILRPRARQ